MSTNLIVILILATFCFLVQNLSTARFEFEQNEKVRAKKYVIIDTDAGVDDALGLMLALDYHKRGLIEILAITCTYGNAYVDQVVKNVLLTQRAANVENVKVYRGVENPLQSRKGYIDWYFGDDGLGNATHILPDIKIRIEKENAVLAMIRLSKQYPNKITLITLGPMTNLAMAIQLDPQFTNNLAEIISMGGLIDMVGNVGPTTEFNFFNDPEAVDTVLEKSVCPLSIVTWDVAINTAVPLKKFNEIINYKTERAEFIEKIFEFNIKTNKLEDNNGVFLCDILAVIAGVAPDLVTHTEKLPVQMELNGNLTRGQLIVGRTPGMPFYGSRNAIFLERFDLQKSIELISQILQN